LAALPATPYCGVLCRVVEHPEECFLDVAMMLQKAAAEITALPDFPLGAQTADLVQQPSAKSRPRGYGWPRPALDYSQVANHQGVPLARIIGTPGESAAARAALLLLLVPGAIVVFVGIPSIYALFYSGDRWGLGGLLGTTLVIAGVFYWHRDVWPEAAELVREGGNYFKGARGEIAVHQELRKLSDEFVVFHDFHPIDPATGKPSRWNVDHIVVGPTGVFVLDAKYYGHKDVRSAQRNQYSARNVRQVQRNAVELQRRLATWSAGQLKELFVVGVVVYVQPDAHLERLKEGATRTLPLRLLRHEVTSHAESAIDQERAAVSPACCSRR